MFWKRCAYYLLQALCAVVAGIQLHMTPAAWGIVPAVAIVMTAIYVVMGDWVPELPWWDTIIVGVIIAVALVIVGLLTGRWLAVGIGVGPALFITYMFYDAKLRQLSANIQ